MALILRRKLRPKEPMSPHGERAEEWHVGYRLGLRGDKVTTSPYGNDGVCNLNFFNGWAQGDVDRKEADAKAQQAFYADYATAIDGITDAEDVFAVPGIDGRTAYVRIPVVGGR